jgi:hypothetical protein
MMSRRTPGIHTMFDPTRPRFPTFSLSSRMTLLYSHGRHLPTSGPFRSPLMVHVSASRCRYHQSRVRQRRYATIAEDDIASAPHKPLPPLKNPFPYPNNAKPTPHQIFHLPVNATQAQIKARCKSIHPLDEVTLISIKITSSSTHTTQTHNTPPISPGTSRSTAFAPSKRRTTTLTDALCPLTLTRALRRRRRTLIRTYTRWRGGEGRITLRRRGRRRMWMLLAGRGRGGGRGLVRRRVRGRSGMGRVGGRGWCLRLGLWCVDIPIFCMPCFAD